MVMWRVQWVLLFEDPSQPRISTETAAVCEAAQQHEPQLPVGTARTSLCRGSEGTSAELQRELSFVSVGRGGRTTVAAANDQLVSPKLGAPTRVREKLGISTKVRRTEVLTVFWVSLLLLKDE